MKRSIGLIILQVSVALYLFVNGILGLSKDSNEFTRLIKEIFGRGDLSNILAIVFSVCAIIAGLFLLLELFSLPIPVTDLILFIFIILWAVYIILVDIIAPIRSSGSFFNTFNIWSYLSTLSSHLMVLGSIMAVNKRFS
ncbi:hypothetical protein K7I13_04920 [Brucepastera parasyntrophica]|uniref:hypothetical protein n=1 Tax=Brucepastera parasyntrophica TaxID=2880008 RepID=UPI002108F4D8|nr:hypothetical protein [Brucepastera parasyntrophica]ULQ60623.1 hypothetical protein K7I13_04920 [Brucepastera parasyntrophica]